MRKLFTLLIAVMASLGTMFASDTQVNGIWYNFDSSTHTATVTYQGSSYNSYSGEYTGSVVIPASVTYNNEEYSVISIGYRAFYNCKSLTSVTIPNSVTSIRGDAFSYCSGLSSVTIGNGVTNIGSNAFLECENLTSVRISDLAAWCTILFERAIDQGENTQYANPLYYAGNLYLNNTLVDDLVIPNGVTEIGFQAFAYCTSITSVTIPEGVTSLGKGAFLGCSNLSSIKLPTSLTNLGTYTFFGCSNLTSIKIPNNVTIIGEYTFENCTNLTSVEIPSSVTYIGYEAFAYCRNLTSFTNHAATPQSMDTPCFTMVTLANATLYVPAESIALYNAYPNWAQFGTIKAIGDNPAPCIIASGTCGAQGDNLTWTLTCDSVLTISGTGAMADYQNATQTPWNGYSSLIQSVIMNDNVTTVSNYAFAFCSNLKNVSLNQTLTTIGEHAFFSCPLLESVVIPDNVIVIGYNAFAQCSWLTSVHIGNKVTTIGKGAFARCGRLSSVVMFNSVTSIGENAFDNCSALTTINIPNSITSIGKETFAFCAALTSIEIPESVTSIGENAFYGCSGLTSIAIPNSVTTIGNGAFAGCTGLTSVTIGNSVTSIGGFAFEGCRGLTSITNYAIEPQTINSNVFTNVDKSTCTLYVPAESVEAYQTADVWKDFGNILAIDESGIENPCIIASGTCGAQGDNLTWTLSCDSVLTISGTGAMADYEWNGAPWYSNNEAIRSVIIENSVTSIGDYAFRWCYGLTSVEIPNSVTSIGSYAFNGCSSLISIEIPNSVISIGDNAFYGCSGLTSVEIPNSVTSIGSYAFNGCSSLISIEIPNSVTSIGSYAFNGCSSLISIEIPNSVISIGDGVLARCNNLTSINVNAINANYSSLDGVLFNKDMTALIQYPGGKQGAYTIPNGVTIIRSSAFCGCSDLISVTIPNSVTIIRGQAFQYCSSLTSVEIPNSVTIIGNGAFRYCYGLTSVEISNSVTSIEKYAFRYCSGLTSFTNYATTPQAINANVFEDVNQSACTLYVPAESIKLYKAADVWKEFGNILPIEESGEVEVLSIAEAIQIGMVLDSMATSAETYTIEGYVINAGTFNSGAKYQNWYMADDQETVSSDFQAYKCYPIDGIDTVVVRNGSKVRMTGHLQKYYDRQKALYVVEMTYTPAIILSKPQIDTITVAEALALGAELEDNASTSKQYAIRGYVSSVSQYYEQLGDQDFYIADDPNSTANTNAAGGFYVYRGVPSTGTAVNKGDLVELTCAIRKYVPASGTNIKIENSEFPISVTVLQTASDTCIVASGTCGAEGDNLTWTLSCDSVLTISGTGRMANYVLTNSKSPAPWYTYHTAIKSVVIEDGVTSIGKNAFSECDMALVMMSGSVSAIADYAFSSCKKIISVDVAIDNQNYCSVDGILFNKNKTTLILYPAAKSDTSYSIPESVTRIGTASFEYCDSLSNIHIPNSVISIGRSAFYGSSTLTYIAIPNSVTSIEEGAFIDCRGLTSVTIGNSVTSIVSSAFYNCSSLTTITNYAATPQTISSYVFTNVNISSCTLYVPAQSVAAYQAADVWKEFGNILPIGGTTPPQESDREGQSTEGRDFWVTFMQADQDPNNDLVLSLSISSRENCQVQISNPYTEYMESFYVTGGQTQIVQLYQGNVLLANARTEMANSGKVCYAGYSEQVDTCALRVTATSDISLFATNYKRATFDATNVLPTALLGDEYIIQTYTPSDHGGVDRSQGSHFAIIATEDNTIVDYCPTVMTQAITDSVNVAQAKRDFMGEDVLTEREKLWLHYTIGDTIHTPVLMAGQVFYVWTGKKDGETGDLSGTYVKARDGKRIAVFQGNPHTNIPYQVKQRDQLYSQAMPVRYWGNTFALTASATRPSDIIRVMAVHDGTEVYINGEPVHTFDFTVDTKHFWEFEIGPSGTYAQEGSCMLATSHPVGVHLFLTSQQYYGDKNSNGDPAMTWVSPIDQQMDQVTFATYESATGGMTSYVNVVTDRPELMTLDALSITSDFSPVSGSNIYYYARIPLSYASHTLKSNGGKFNAHVYGFSSNESYAYSAGSFIEALSLNIYINGEPVSPVNDMCVSDTLFMDITTSFDYQSMKLDFGDGTVVYATDEEGIHARHAYDAPGVYHANVVVASNNNRLDIPIRIFAGPLSLTYEPLNYIYVGDSIFYIYYHSPIQEMQIDEDFTIDRSFNDAALQDGFGHYTTRLNRSFFGIRIPEGARAGVEYAFNVDIHTPCGDYTATIPFVLKARRTGSCGDNLALTWTYDAETKTLTITGNGALNSNYTFGLEAPLEMEQLIIAEGVTSIGANAFSNMSTLQTMQLPASLKTIGASAFENDINLTAIYNYRERPCLVDATAFNGVNKFDCTLYVLEGSVDMYKSSISDWKDFYFILPIGTTEVTEPVSDVTVEPHDNSATVTWPTSNNAATYTIQITKDGVLFCTLIFNANGQLIGIAFAPGREGAYHAPAAIMTANGLQFTVTGLNSNTKYSYSVTAKDGNDVPVATYSGEFTTTSEGIATGVEEVSSSLLGGERGRLILLNGQIYILRGEKIYTVTGQEVR